MSRKLNVAFVGVGEFITGNHLPNLYESEDFNICWICDLNKEILKKRTERFKPDKSTSDINDILEDPTVDLVIIGTRQNVRVSLIEKCAQAGKNIFVEKPMSLSNKESSAIINAVKKNGIILQVGYNRRAAPAIIEAKKRFLQFREKAGKPGLIHYRAVDESYLWPDWAFDNEHGGKVFHEGCHFFDLACYLTDQFPVSLYTAGKVSDNQMSILEFPDGTLFSVTNSGEGCNGYPKERMEIYCGWNTIIMDHFIELTVSSPDNYEVLQFPVFREKGKLSQKKYTPAEFYKLNAEWRKNITEEEFEHRHYYGSTPIVDKGHLKQFELLKETILENKPCLCNEIDGANATYVCNKCIESINSGKAVSLDIDYLKCFDKQQVKGENKFRTTPIERRTEK